MFSSKDKLQSRLLYSNAQTKTCAGMILLLLISSILSHFRVLSSLSAGSLVSIKSEVLVRMPYSIPICSNLPVPSGGQQQNLIKIFPPFVMAFSVCVILFYFISLSMLPS
jgi:hypothetical protein